MTGGIPEDVLMLASATNVGKDEIDEFLRCTGSAPGKRCLKRILKRIKHPQNYSGGKLTLRSKVVAWLMIALIALFFALLGYFGARLIHDITLQEEGVTAYLAMFSDDGEEKAEPASIRQFMLPKIPDARYTELVRSSLVYNAEIYTEDGYIYYTQKAAVRKKDTDKEDDDGTAQTDVFYVLIGEHRAEITKDIAADGLFGISWSDGYHTFGITGCRTMEQAVRYAKSLDDADTAKNTEDAAQRTQK